MKNGYVDPYVICPMYKKESSNEERKIYCSGHKKGVYVHIYFKKTASKKFHKKTYCKSDYKKCPLYKSVLEFYKENDDD